MLEVLDNLGIQRVETVQQLLDRLKKYICCEFDYIVIHFSDNSMK